MNKVFNILFTGKLLQTINWKSLDVIDGEIALGRGIESIGVSDWVHDIAVYRDKVFLAGEDGLRRYTIKY